MGASHHGGHPEPPNPELDALMKRFMQQAEGRAAREYPGGRIAADDDGALACAIAADHAHGRVRIDFGKMIAWLSVTPEEAVGLAQMLIKQARAVSKVPLVVEI